MRYYTPYETIYSIEKLHNPDPPLVKEPIPLMTELERIWMAWEGTLLNPDGGLPPDPFNRGIVLPGKSPRIDQDNSSWLAARPFLPDPSGDVWEDARQEFELIKKLNAAGNTRARLKFYKVQQYLNGKLSDKEMNMLKLADFVANEKYKFLFAPGMETAMGILRDYWPRWFGGRANIPAKYNTDLYWIPWSFFMEDDYINRVKDDLVANTLNPKALDSIYTELKTSGKIGDEISDFNFTDEHPLMWNRLAYQLRSARFGFRLGSFKKPQYWALGNFSINALPEGTVIPLERGGHRICVTNVYLFIHDTFNFEGFADLGYWDPESKKFPAFSTQLMGLSNSDFREFRRRHGYGRDFTVLSPLYKLHGFDGKCWDVK